MSTIIDESALTDVERIKEESHGLRGTLSLELENDATHVSHDAERILKFHGSYMQEDRDLRRERKKAGLEPAYQFMVRSKLPGGVMTADQYLVQDSLADKYGNGTMRITTRQGFQFHGILKGDLRASIRDLNDVLVTTFGACGDVVRNVVACPAPIEAGVREEVIEWARVLKDETLPRTQSYHEIWVEGVAVTKDEPEEDPLYHARYLPRKFKIGFGFPEDNCNDVHSNDLGYLAVVEGGTLQGFNVLVGGGLGQTHGKSETFPRLADTLGFTTPEDLVEVSKAVIAVQRDFGNRTTRKRARLKYLIQERGLDWFRGEVESRLGRPLQPAREVEVTGIHDHLGWHRQSDGRWFRGVWVENGRVADFEGGLRLRTALRTLVERFRPDVHLTTQHNVLLVGLREEDRAPVDALLAEHGVIPIEELTPARRWSMACPALPTCGLAVSESERVAPELLTRLEALLAELGLTQEDLTVRMTGCPNGCARPYTADLAFVGRSLGKYVVFVGGSFVGTRLATAYADLVPFDEIIPTVRPLFERYRDERAAGERFGDYWARVGVEPIQRAGARA